MTPAHHPDGNLPAALTALQDAIHELIHPQTRIVNNQPATIPSLYMQLWDAIPGSQGTGHGAARSMPPLWLDAAELLHEIDTAIEATQPAYSGVPPTIGRLHCITNRPWRPQDVHQMQQITAACTQWATQIETLLNPQPKWTLPTPCPSCATSIVYRKDSAGERVRQPALQFGPTGCFCAQCKATWAPERFLFLAKVLGYALPSGVLE